MSVSLLNHVRDHIMHIYLQRVMIDWEINLVLHYGTHASAIKEVEFVHHKITNQVQAGHVVVFTLSDILPPPNCGYLQ